jgi:hypothetical protein
MSSSTSSWDGTERRVNPERRAANRHGKYDRRRNRCGQCAFFARQGLEFQQIQGFCLQHQKELFADAFACVLFEESGTAR